MNCQEVMEYMQRQLDHDLDGFEELLMQDHLHQCKECTAMFERLKLLSAELSSLPKVVPSFSLVDAILPQLKQIDRVQESTEKAPATESELVRRKARVRKWPSFRITGGVIAAGIVAGLFIMFYNPGSSDLNDMAMMESASTAGSPDMSTPNNAFAPANEPSADGSDTGARVTAEGIDHRAASNDEVEGAGSDGVGAQEKMELQSTPESSQDQAGDEPVKGFGAVTTGKSGEAAVHDEEVGMKASINGMQGILGEAVVTSIEEFSPNGEYVAVAEGYMITIMKLSDNSVLWETARKNGGLTKLQWSEDSKQLSYEVHIENGAQEQYTLDIETGTETKQSF